MKRLPHSARPRRLPPAFLQGVVGWLSSRWRRWALILQQKAARIPAHRQKAGVVLGALSLTLSTLVLVRECPADRLPPRALQLPSPGHLAPAGPQEDPRIERLRRGLERLYTTEGGRRVRDSLCRGRPGLRDTLEFLRHYYLPPKNNELWNDKR